eukprot:tig00000767_g3975.t1
MRSLLWAAALLALAASSAALRDGFACQALSYSNLTLSGTNTARLAFSTPYFAAPTGALFCLTTPGANLTELRVRSVLEGGDLFTPTSEKREVLDTTRFTSSVGRWGMQQVEPGTLADVLANDPYYAHSYANVRYDDFPRTPAALATLQQATPNCAVITADWAAYTRYEITVSFTNPEGVDTRNTSRILNWWAAPLTYDRIDDRHLALSVRGSKYGLLCGRARGLSNTLVPRRGLRSAPFARDSPGLNCGSDSVWSASSGACVRCNGAGSRPSEDGRRCDCGPGLIPALVGTDACSGPLLPPGANLTAPIAPRDPAPERSGQPPTRRAARSARARAKGRDLRQTSYCGEEGWAGFVPSSPRSLADLAQVICCWMAGLQQALRQNRLADPRVAIETPASFAQYAEPLVDQYILDKANATLWGRYTRDGRRLGVPTRSKGIQWTCFGCVNGSFKDYTRSATVALNPYDQDLRFMNVQSLRGFALALALSDPAYACPAVLDPGSASSTTAWTYTELKEKETSLAVIDVRRKLQEFTESTGHQSLLFCMAMLAISIYIANTYVSDVGLDRCQLVVSIFFVVELVLQFASADEKMGYLFSWFGLVDVCSALPIIHFMDPGINTLIVSLLRFCVILRMSRVVVLFQVWSSQDNDVYREVVYLCFSIVSFILFASGLVHWLDGEWRLFSGGEPGPGAGPAIQFHEALYFVFVSISTVGYGDYTPATASGQLLTLLLLCAAITIFPLRAGRLISALSQTTYSRASYSARGRSAHVVVTGDFTGQELEHLAAELLRPVRASVGPEGAPLGLVPRHWLPGGILSRLLAGAGAGGAGREAALHLVLLARGDPPPDVLGFLRSRRHRGRLHYLAGSPLSAGDLRRAAVRRARALFVVSRELGRDVGGGDGSNLLACVAARQVAPATPIFLMHATSDASGRAGRLGATVSVCLEDAKMRLLARSVVCPGLAALVSNISTQDRRVFLHQGAGQQAAPPGAASEDEDAEQAERTSKLLHRRLVSVQGSIASVPGAGAELELQVPGRPRGAHAYALPEDVQARSTRFRHLSSFFMRKAEPAVGVSSPWQVEYDYGVANGLCTVPLGPPFEGLPWRRAALAAYDSHGVLLLGVQPAGESASASGAGGPTRRGSGFIAAPSDRPCRAGDVALCIAISPRRAERLSGRRWSSAAAAAMAAAAARGVPAELAEAAGELLAGLDGDVAPAPAAQDVAAAPRAPAPAPPAAAGLPAAPGAPAEGAPAPAPAPDSAPEAAMEALPDAPEGVLGAGGHVAVFGRSPLGPRLAPPRPEQRRGLYGVPGAAGRGPYAMATLARARAHTASAVLVLAERRGGGAGEGVDTPAVLAALEAMAARRPTVVVDLVFDSSARFLNGALAGDAPAPPHSPAPCPLPRPAPPRARPPARRSRRPTGRAGPRRQLEAERHVRLCPAFAAGAVYSHAALYTLLCLCYHQGPACVAFLHYALESPRHLQQTALPAAFAGRPYRDLVAALLLCTPFVPLGLFRAPGTGGAPAPFVYTNPHPATRLLPSDRVFLLRGRAGAGPASSASAVQASSATVSRTFDF